MLEDLHEDRLTAWAPDLLAYADAAELLNGVSHGRTLQSLNVPRLNGESRRQVVVHPYWHLTLHKAVKPIRTRAGRQLHPAVFGYRLGADAHSRYADEWRRFCDFNAAETAAAAWYVETDIARFSDHLRWQPVLAAAEEIAGKPLPKLHKLASAFEACGVPFPPGGYGDFRLLYNCLLTPVDRALEDRFSRWVDDFRLFASSKTEVRARLKLLRELLAERGLQLNEDKTRVLRSAEGRERNENAFAGIYCLDDPIDVRRHKLRRAFQIARHDPVGQRVLLRFTLGRLEKERDPVAVSFALSQLEEMPSEAPRLISYLAAFPGEQRIQRRLDTLLRQAAKDENVWLIVRVGALMLRSQPAPGTLRALHRQLDAFAGTPAWAVAVRLCARFGTLALPSSEGEDVDARALLVAQADRGDRLDEALCRVEPSVALALSRLGSRLPLPELRSLL